MRKLLLIVLVFAGAAITIQAQKSQTLKKVMELKMPKTAEDKMPGNRGASVSWHPLQKKYYAVFAGNMEYPLAIFDATGKRLSPDDQMALIDVRGLWYDPVSKLISGNAYDEYGWFTYKLDKNGMPTDLEVENEGQNQPDPQSVGIFNPTAKQVLFLHGGQVYMYDSEGEAEDSLAIHWSRKKSDGPADDEDILDSPEDYNYTSVIYTGIKGQELGFLNITNKEIELYDIKTGYLTKTLSLPETAIMEASFNFAYTNGVYWLFNRELRKWVGYK